MHALQDKFNDFVQENGFDLERGISSDRKHIEINKFKAMTQQKELEKLESKLDNIKPLNQELERIEKIEGKTAFNKTILTKEDYELLHDTAKNSVKAIYELEDTKEQLKHSQTEFEEFRREVSTSQEKLKTYVAETVQNVKDEAFEIKQENNALKSENARIKENLNDLAVEKAQELKTAFENEDLEKVYDKGFEDAKDQVKATVIPKYAARVEELKNENFTLRTTAKELSVEKEELQQENKVLTSSLESTQSHAEKLKEENSRLEDENSGLKAKVDQLASYVHELKSYLTQMINRIDHFKESLKVKISSFISIKITQDPKLQESIPPEKRFKTSQRIQELFKEESNKLFEEAERKADDKILERSKENNIELER